MPTLSSSYRLAAMLVLTALSWSLALPVVHMVCAMESMTMAEHCAHEASAADQMAMHHESGHVPDASSHDMSCCVVEQAAVERPFVRAASICDDVKPVLQAGAVDRTPSIENGAPDGIARVPRGAPPTISSPSRALLSVYLI